MTSKHIHHHERYTQEELAQACSLFFGTLVSEQRLAIIALLRIKERNVSELIAVLKTEQTALSHDLARLRRCGFVTVTKEGKYRVYHLAEDIRALMHLIDTHMRQHCVHIVRGERK